MYYSYFFIFLFFSLQQVLPKTFTDIEADKAKPDPFYRYFKV